MAWKMLREIKSPRSEDIAKGVAHWVKAEAIARQRLARAENSAARQRQMDRISFCQVAAMEAKKQGIQ